MSLLPRALALAVSTSLLSALPAHATNGYFAHGYGIKSKGLAGAGIALPQDSLTIATNPAGLVLVGTRLDVGADWFVPARESAYEGNLAGPDVRFDANDTEGFLIPEFGYSRAFSERFSAGIAVYGNGGMNTDYDRNPFGRFGSTGEAGVDLSQLFVSPALAWRVDAHHRLGLGVNFAYQRFEARGLDAFAPFSSDPAHLTNQGHDDASGWGVRLGYLGSFLDDRFSVGASWQSKTRTGDFDDYRGLFADGGGFDIPESYGAGVAFKLTPSLTATLDWQEILYSEVGAVGNPVAPLLQGVPLGADEGPGFGWRDVSVWKLGVQYQVSPSLNLRAGYSSAGQPIPEGETFFNILAPGVIEEHLSLGATWAIGSRDELSFAYTHAFEQEVKGQDSIAPAFGGGEANLVMDQNSFGVAWGHAF